MPSTYPTSIDSFTANTDDVDDVLAEDINELQDAIEATETKLGTGSSTPANAKILKGNGAGSSAWDLDFKDEDDMASNSATAVPSQQSTKAYVDGRTPAATDAVKGVVELATDAEALAGSSDSVVLTPGNLGYTGFLTGWIPAGETWTYASATTFTISGSDETDKFTKGTKIKLTNDSSTKYFYVVSSSFSTNTTVTVTGETDLVSGAITNPYYSYADCPQGFKKGEDWYKCIVGDLSSTQSLTTTLTTVVFTDDTYNPNSSYNTSTGQFTAPISGYYSIKTLLRINKATVGDSILVVYQLSTGSVVAFDHLNNYDASVMYANNTADIYLAKGETLVVYIRNTTASRGEVNDVVGLGYNRFSVKFSGL